MLKSSSRSGIHVLGYCLLELVFLGTHDLIQNLPSFQKYESRHCLHCPVCGNRLQQTLINHQNLHTQFAVNAYSHLLN